MRRLLCSALLVPWALGFGCSGTIHDSNSNSDAVVSPDALGDDGGPGLDAGTGADAGPDAAPQPDAAVGTPLMDRLEVSQITVPEGVKAGVSNWRIWGTGSLYVAPVFTVPLANCETLVGFTTGSGGSVTARVARLDANDQLVETLVLDTGFECRGLAAEPDGHYAALLWDDSADAIFVRRFDLAGATDWTTELVNGDNTPDDFTIGDSRFEYGDGRYGAYYHVHSTSGHEGDTLKYADAVTGAESTSWTWGCSHSMSNLLRYNTTLDTFLPVCVTDCYPGTSGSFSTNSIGGIYLNHSASKVMDLDAGCNGSVAGEIGSAALAPDGWKLVFNTHQAPATLGQSSYNSSTMNQDIGFSAIATGLGAGAVVWLTNTPSVDEADSSIARWRPAGDTTEQYVVGWSEPSGGYSYKIARVDASGTFLEGPVDISAQAEWGRRDDPFRQQYNGDIVWAWFDAPGSTTLNFARLVSGSTYSCASF